MAIPDIDFEGGSSNVDNNVTNQTPDNNGNPANNQEDVTNLNGAEVVDINDKNTTTTPEDNTNKGDGGNDNPSTGELAEGDELEYDGQVYKVDANGNIIDNKGNIFKEAKDVKEWLKSVDVADEKDIQTLDVASIRDALGFEITDEDGKPIEFTNDVNGVKSLVDSVIDIRSKELQEAAINRLYQDNPLLKQFQDYVQLN